MSGLLSAAIPAAASLLGSGINAMSVGKTNKKTRQHNEKMYNQQVSDNVRLWTMQNEYNSPAAQMQRLKDAGLNPNLVYGKGADNVAAPIQKGEQKSWTPEAPQLDLNSVVQSGLQGYNNFALKDAQVNNLISQNTVTAQEAALKGAQTASTMVKTAKDQFDLDLASELRTVSADVAKESLRKLQADINYTISENERKAVMNVSNLKEAAQRILKMREETTNSQEQRMLIQAQISNVINDTTLKDLDIELKRNGINPNDPIYFRVLGRLLGDFSPTQYLKSINPFKK